MAGVPEKVLNWLYSVLPSEYADVNRTYSDVAEALSNYPSLSPRTEVYTYENGASALLLLLNGTVPVTFRGATYAFPVSIWVPHAYPRESPIVYVMPSQDMVIRPGQHVAGDGRIYHPYLAQWGKYWDKSTIFDFLAVLRGVFAKEPPVRSKQQPFNPASNQPAPPPVPPTPAEWRQSVQSPPTASPAHFHAPIPPPKPPKPHEQSQERHSRLEQRPPPPIPPHPQPSIQGQYARQNNWQQQGGPSYRDGAPQSVPPKQMSYDTNPPTPLDRPLRPQVQAQGSQPHQNNSYEYGSPVSPITPDDQSQRPSRYQQPAPLPQPSQPTQRPPGYPPQQPQPQYSAPPLGHPLNQPQAYPGYQPSQSQPYPPQPVHQQPPKPKPPVPDLLDSPLDVTLPSQTGQSAPLPAPPIPPNPEKDALLKALSHTLLANLHRSITENTAALPALQSQQSALRQAHSRLQSELDQLQQLDAALASNEQILRDAMVEADRVMEDARTRKVPDVDEVLVAPTVVGGQLYAVCAEERAVAEALFVLGRALDKGRVGADVFVKQTRSLAREQFLKKALIKKISKGMALDEYQMR